MKSHTQLLVMLLKQLRPEELEKFKKEKNGWMMSAATQGSVRSVALLHSYGFSIFIKESKESYSPLHLACTNGNTDVALWLILHGLNVNERSASGVTPLYLATQKGFLPLVKLLLSNEADSSATTAKGTSSTTS